MALLIGVNVGYHSYKLALYYEEGGQVYVSDEIYYVDSARRILRDIFNVQVNESMFSNKTNPDYYNMEHPPLGKYIIAASIAACGDEPLCWRAPSIIEASTIPVLVYLAFSRRGQGSSSLIIAGIAGAIAAAADRILYASGSLAMLDIHLAFFGTMSLALALHGRWKLSAAAAGLATAVKYSGAAFVVAVALIHAWRQKKPVWWIYSFVEAIVFSVAAFSLTFIPLILYFGPEKVVEEIVAGLGWHTTARPDGPPTSTPAGWIINANPFFFTFNYIPVAATVTTPLHVYSLMVAPLLILASACERVDKERVISGPAMYFSVLAIYLLVIILGNNTLYSFYAVQLTPGVAATVAASVVAGDCIGRAGVASSSRVSPARS